MTYEEKIMLLSVGKVVKITNTMVYTHVIRFEYNEDCPLNRAIVVMVGGKERLLNMDDIEL